MSGSSARFALRKKMTKKRLRRPWKKPKTRKNGGHGHTKDKNVVLIGSVVSTIIRFLSSNPNKPKGARWPSCRSGWWPQSSTNDDSGHLRMSRGVSDASARNIRWCLTTMRKELVPTTEYVQAVEYMARILVAKGMGATRSPGTPLFFKSSQVKDLHGSQHTTFFDVSICLTF